MLIKKTYLGEMSASATGQMISKKTDNGTAVYYAIEEFSGSVKGKNGGFTLVHKGHIAKRSSSFRACGPPLDVKMLCILILLY